MISMVSNSFDYWLHQKSVFARIFRVLVILEVEMKSKKNLLFMSVILLSTFLLSTKFFRNKEYEKKERLAFYVEREDGSFQLGHDKVFPKEGYVLNELKSNCQNGGTISQDEATRSVSVSVKSEDSCSLYFECERYPVETLASGLNFYDTTKGKQTFCNEDEMYVFDHPETVQTTGWSEAERRDYRYIGKNPKNYIEFNDEIWRIIGVFTVENEDGTKTQNMKIIKNESIGDLPWDIKEDGTYQNVWTSSSLNSFLNTEYYNTSGVINSIYYDINREKHNITIEKGLNQSSREKISSVKWYLGPTANFETIPVYSIERNSKYSFGKVGIIYESDYFYTYGNGVDDICFSKNHLCYSSSGAVPSASWLYTGKFQWTMTVYSGNYYDAVNITEVGAANVNTTDRSNIHITNGVRPVVYLSSEVKIHSGDGSKENPYKIE